jgi:hypothetical protein
MHDPKVSVQNYRICRATLNQISWDVYDDDWRPAMQNLFLNFINAADPEICRRQAGFAKATEDGLIEKANVLREIFRPISDRYSEQEIFQDVFEVATYISLSSGGLWVYNPAIPRYFRGQRRNWPVIPSILRDCQDTDEIATAVKKLTKFARALQRVRGVTDEQAVAIAQHYSSKENGLRTWLLDVTRDPLVALFFASLGGKSGDHGLLWLISEGEWNRLAGASSNLLGAIRAVEIPGIHRISAQKGLFIDTSHPELFDQYVPHTIEFQQVEGLVFEDDQLDVPITTEFLLRDDDQLESIIEDSTEADTEPPLACPHPVYPLRKLTGLDYFEIVTSWAHNHPTWEVNDDNRSILKVLCAFHACLQESAAAIANDKQLVSDLTALRSLHNLWRGVELVFDLPSGDILELNYLTRTGNPRLKEMLQNIAEEILNEHGWRLA